MDPSLASLCGLAHTSPPARSSGGGRKRRDKEKRGRKKKRVLNLRFTRNILLAPKAHRGEKEEKGRGGRKRRGNTFSPYRAHIGGGEKKRKKGGGEIAFLYSLAITKGRSCLWRAMLLLNREDAEKKGGEEESKAEHSS